MFYFAGRNADWLRVDGENFAAAPVERVIQRFPGIAGVAVFGVPDDHTADDQVMAAIELADGTELDPAAFDAFLTEQRDLGTKWSPRYLRVVSSLPVTATNKIDKAPLRRDRWVSTGDDPVYWRPERRDPLRPLTDGDRVRDPAAVRVERSRRGAEPVSAHRRTPHRPEHARLLPATRLLRRARPSAGRGAGVRVRAWDQGGLPLRRHPRDQPRPRPVLLRFAVCWSMTRSAKEAASLARSCTSTRRATTSGAASSTGEFTGRATRPHGGRDPGPGRRPARRHTRAARSSIWSTC